MQNNRIIQVEDKVPPRLLVPLSIQHMFAMFGASVLVPFIFKMNPAIVLFMNGIGGAAVISIICSFVGPLAALIQTIPGPVIGGISFLLYGMIGTSGLRILVDNHVDYSKNRNMILTSVIFVTGLSGVTLSLGDVSLSGMTLAAIVAMIMSLVFHALDRAKLTNDV